MWTVVFWLISENSLKNKIYSASASNYDLVSIAENLLIFATPSFEALVNFLMLVYVTYTYLNLSLYLQRQQCFSNEKIVKYCCQEQ